MFIIIIFIIITTHTNVTFFFFVCVKCESSSVVSNFFVTVACQVPLSMEFSMQEY